MSHGSRYWASSRVDLKNGQTYFVDDSDYSIRKKMNSNAEMITLRTAGIRSSEIHIRKDEILSYRSYSLF